MKKVANKIAFIIFALLAVLFTVFAAMNYNGTKNTILDVSANSKEAIARSLEVYADKYLIRLKYSYVIYATGYTYPCCIANFYLFFSGGKFSQNA